MAGKKLKNVQCFMRTVYDRHTLYSHQQKQVVPENTCISSASVVLPEIPPTKMRFGIRVPYLGALLLLLVTMLCCGCEMCELVVTRFTDEAGDEEAVDPSGVHVLADDCNQARSPVTSPITTQTAPQLLKIVIKIKCQQNFVM
jgi:hypothetical protein